MKESLTLPSSEMLNPESPDKSRLSSGFSGFKE
jgi:hypothetical protein